MGYSKNYIMYWGGVTSSIIAYAYFCVNTHDSQILQKSLLLFVHFHQIERYILNNRTLLTEGRKIILNFLLCRHHPECTSFGCNKRSCRICKL